MINEKMIELLLMIRVSDVLKELDGEVFYMDRKLDMDKFMKRLDELSDEFLEPYLIDSDSKE